jgi:hypothetical protein
MSGVYASTKHGGSINLGLLSTITYNMRTKQPSPTTNPPTAIFYYPLVVFKLPVSANSMETYAKSLNAS